MRLVLGTCDAQYHVMWVILQSAVEEFGLREVKAGTFSLEVFRDIERQIFDEALVGALRIAGLVGRKEIDLKHH
jgi:hypothetical protein